MELNGLAHDIKPAVIDNQLFRKPSPEYLQELLQDKQKLQYFQRNFKFRHLLSILEKEINRVREKLFRVNGTSGQNRSIDMSHLSPKGEYVTMQEKVYLPVDENPNFNFIGRILGPRGLTAKQLEQELQCKLMIRGKGSLRNKEKEEELLGKPNWEHLTEKLHIMITVEDYENRAAHKLNIAKEAIEKFIEHGVKVPDGEDDIKKRQLMELAIINGTYRDTSKKNNCGGPNLFNNHQATISHSIQASELMLGNSLLGNGTLVSDFHQQTANGCLLPVVTPHLHHIDSSSYNNNNNINNTNSALPPSSSSTNTISKHNKSVPIPNLPPSLYDPTNTTNFLNAASILSSHQHIPTSAAAAVAVANQLYNLPDLTNGMAAAVASSGFIGPIRLRNLTATTASAFRQHPYQLLGNI